MSFEDLKSRIKARGKPTSPEGFLNLMKAFTGAEEMALITTQRMIAEGNLSDTLEASVKLAMRHVIDELDYTPQEAADFLRLGKEIIAGLPPRPDILARMSAYMDEDGNPYISQTRH